MLLSITKLEFSYHKIKKKKKNQNQYNLGRPSTHIANLQFKKQLKSSKTPIPSSLSVHVCIFFLLFQFSLSCKSGRWIYSPYMHLMAWRLDWFECRRWVTWLCDCGGLAWRRWRFDEWLVNLGAMGLSCWSWALRTWVIWVAEAAFVSTMTVSWGWGSYAIRFSKKSCFCLGSSNLWQWFLCLEYLNMLTSDCIVEVVM